MKIILFTALLFLSLNGMAQNNTFPSSGYVGVGTTSPGAKLSFNNVSDGSDGPDGITWYNPSPLNYGIFRSAGPWSYPNYQQLVLSFETGIILNPGTPHAKSYVDIQGNGFNSYYWKCWYRYNYSR